MTSVAQGTPTRTPTQASGAPSKVATKTATITPPASETPTPSPTRQESKTPTPDAAGQPMGRVIYLPVIVRQIAPAATPTRTATVRATPPRTPTNTATVTPARPGATPTLAPAGVRGPNALVVDQSNGLLWVAGRDTSDVQALSLDTLHAVRRTTVGLQPFGAGILNGLLYVANYQAGTVARVDTSTGTRLSPDILVGGEPSWLAVDPLRERVWVAMHSGGGVAIIANDSVWRRVSTGPGPFAVTIDVSRRQAYVGNRDAKSVTVLNVDSGDIIRSLSLGGSPFGMAVNETTGQLYVLHGPASGDCPVTQMAIYEADGLLFREVLVGDSCPGGWIVVNPANGRVYVAATAVDQVWVFEPDGRLRAILDQDRGFDEPLGLAIAPQAELLYVGNHAGNTIAVMPAP